MGKVVKLSDSLVDSAWAACKMTKQTLSGQITHWVYLGQCIEPYLTGQQVMNLLSRREPSRKRSVQKKRK